MKAKSIALIIILLALAAFVGVYLYFDKSADDSDDTDTKGGNTNNTNNTNPNTNKPPSLEELEAEELAEELANLHRTAIMIGVTAEGLPNIAYTSNTR